MLSHACSILWLSKRHKLCQCDLEVWKCQFCPSDFLCLQLSLLSCLCLPQSLLSCLCLLPCSSCDVFLRLTCQTIDLWSLPHFVDCECRRGEILELQKAQWIGLVSLVWTVDELWLRRFCEPVEADLVVLVCPIVCHLQMLWKDLVLVLDLQPPNQWSQSPCEVMV